MTYTRYKFRSWFSRQRGENKPRATRLWKDIDVIFPKPPFSLRALSLSRPSKAYAPKACFGENRLSNSPQRVCYLAVRVTLSVIRVSYTAVYRFASHRICLRRTSNTSFTCCLLLPLLCPKHKWLIALDMYRKQQSIPASYLPTR